METHTDANFKRNYERHLQHLKLKGLQPKTIDAYSRAIRQAGERFDQQIDDLSAQQLTDYFSERLDSHSWSAVKLDLYGLRFYYEHVLAKPWPAPGLVKPIGLYTSLQLARKFPQCNITAKKTVNIQALANAVVNR